jgi:hypothetical protein
MSAARRLLSAESAKLLAVALVVALAMTLVQSRQQADADHFPADQATVAASTAEVAGPGDEITILRTRMRTSTPSDLILQLTAECTIITNLKTIGDDESRAAGTIETWIEVDGKRVPVAEGDEDGEVTLCHRAYERKTSMFDDDDATIETFLDTKASHGFNWMALNVGNGIKLIEVKARLTEEATVENATAKAVIGNRTLIIEPTKAAHDETRTTEETPEE